VLLVVAVVVHTAILPITLEKMVVLVVEVALQEQVVVLQLQTLIQIDKDILEAMQHLVS
jgi:hypothetical protein